MLTGKGVVGWSEGHSRRLRLGCRRPSAGSAAWSHGAGSACAGIDKGRRGLLPVIDLPRSCQFPWQKHRPRSSAAAPARLSFSCRRSALRARGGGRSVCRRAVIVVLVDRLRAAAPHAGARAASRQAATRSHGRTASSFPHCFDHQHLPQYPRPSTHDLSRVQLLYRCASASRRGLVLARPSVLPRSRARGG